LAWQAILAQTLGIDKTVDMAYEMARDPSSPGPHCAAGKIQYGPNEKGILL
jgi:hypothetical protein